MPLATHGHPMGALALHRRAPEPPTPDMLAFMESFAQQCAQALERAQLYEAERRARQEARRRARVRAEEANRAKMEFLAAMSHELRTPLNAIGGYAQLLELGIHGGVSDEQREPLMRIRRSQQHLLGIINDILNFSRIDAGQITYDLATVPVHEVLESVGQMIAPLADAKGPDVRDRRAVRPDAVAWADRAKVEQILLNLLSNAVKFTAHGGRVTLVVRARRRGPRGAHGARHGHRDSGGPARADLRAVRAGRPVTHRDARRRRSRSGDQSRSRARDGRRARRW